MNALFDLFCFIVLRALALYGAYCAGQKFADWQSDRKEKQLLARARRAVRARRGGGR